MLEWLMRAQLIFIGALALFMLCMLLLILAVGLLKPKERGDRDKTDEEEP